MGKENGITTSNTEKNFGNENLMRSNRFYSSKKEIPSEISIFSQENKSNIDFPKEILENKQQFQPMNPINTYRNIHKIDYMNESTKPILKNNVFTQEIPKYKNKSISTKEYQKISNDS